VGASKGSLDLAACASIFRNSKADFIGGFSSHLGI